MKTQWISNRAALATYRTRNGLSPEALGRQIGVTGQTIRNWESGLREPRLSDVTALANLYRVSPLAFCMLVANRPRLIRGNKQKLDTAQPPRGRRRDVCHMR